MTLGTSTRFLLVATRAPDRRMQSHSGYYKPSPWTSSKTSSPRSARSRRLSAQCKPIVSAHKIGAGKPLAGLWHACGYALANAGHDTRALQTWLGHRNIQHTVRYTELAPDRFKNFWR
jgi:type 1 fimbriae regulatory protein FimB/type 1 fimbriae regulatory protein FimE